MNHIHDVEPCVMLPEMRSEGLACVRQSSTVINAFDSRILNPEVHGGSSPGKDMNNYGEHLEPGKRPWCFLVGSITQCYVVSMRLTKVR